MAAGNDGRNANRNFPGCVRLPDNNNKLITVGATSCGRNCALHSNYGRRVDYVAVGSDVFSLYLKNGENWQYMVG